LFQISGKDLYALTNLFKKCQNEGTDLVEFAKSHSLQLNEKQNQRMSATPSSSGLFSTDFEGQQVF